MTRYQYDAEASERLRMDVVHEIGDSPTSPARWLAAMRRLNAIDDPLARKIVALHRDCGSGDGPCNSDDDPDLTEDRAGWGCETTATIAQHFGVQTPEAHYCTRSIEQT